MVIILTALVNSQDKIIWKNKFTTTYFTIHASKIQQNSTKTNITSFHIQCKTKNGFQKVTFLPKNGTINESMIFIHSRYGQNVQHFGKKELQNIVVSKQFIDNSFKIYNSAIAIYNFNSSVFDHFFDENGFLLQLHSNFYEPYFQKGYYQFTNSEQEIFDFKRHYTYIATIKIEYWIEFHPLIYVAQIISSLYWIVMTFLFRNVHPLKAHGYVPLASIFMITWTNIWSFGAFIPDISWSKYIMTYCRMLGRAHFISVVAIFPINLFRYLSLTYLNYRKTIYQNEMNREKKRFLIQLLTFLSHKLTLPALLMVINILVTIICLLISFIFPDDFMEIVIYLTWISLISPLMIFLLMIFDGIYLIKHMIEKWKKYNGECGKLWFPFSFLMKIIKEDRFHFRFQIYFLGVLILYPLIFLFPNINYGENSKFQSPFQEMLEIAYTTFVYILILMSSCTLFTTLAIFNKIRSLFQKKKGEQMMEVFENEQLLELFIDFAEYEFSIENVRCYKDIMTYKTLTLDKQREHLDKFNKLYLLSSSELEVNLPHSKKKIFQDALKNDNITDDILETIEIEVSANLGDTFSRFVLTPEFENYDFTQKIIEN
eukprot:gene4549-7933_t